MSLPYLGCGTRRSTTTRRVLFILSDVTAPISVLRRERAGVDLVLVVLSGLIVLDHAWLVVLIGWNFPTNWLVGGRSRDRSLPLDFAEPQDRLDPGDLALGLDDLAGSLEPLGFTLQPEAEQVVLDIFQEQFKLLVGLITKLCGFAHGKVSPGAA